MGGSRRGTRRGAVLALALLLGGCAPNAVSTRTDEFTAATTVDGLSASIIPLMGPKIEWRIVSSVGKAPPHDVAHRIVIEVAESDLFSTGEIVDERFHFAADDTATPLKIAQIGAGHCGMSDPKCLKHQTFAIPVTDALLRQRVLRGYRIKIGERERESDILTLSPAMIQQQLSKVDNLVQGETATPAAPPGTPRLGIGVVAATSAPYAAEPRGVIVVVTTPQSPAAAAGVTPGDVLLAIDAQPIRVTGDIARILAGLSQPHAVTLELERAGKPFSATLQL